MDRRKSIKIIATGMVAGTAAIAGCDADDKKAKQVPEKQPAYSLDRNPDEIKNEKRLAEMEPFFSPHEMATIAVLSDIIIPADEISGSATDAKVPEFIEFIVKDMPNHQVPMKGGLRWLDVHCMNRFGNAFKDCSNAEQMMVVDEIAYPTIETREGSSKKIIGKVKPGMEPGVAFFSLMRNLTATGFYTSEIGVRDIGYMGNKATQWNGVPDEVLKQYNVAYTEKELKECISFNKT